MRVTLTLRVYHATIASRTIDVHDLARLSGDVGQEAWKLYTEAKAKGYDPIGTTLTVTEGEPSEAETHAKRAAAMVAAGQRPQGRRR